MRTMLSGLHTMMWFERTVWFFRSMETVASPDIMTMARKPSTVAG